MKINELLKEMTLQSQSLHEPLQQSFEHINLNMNDYSHVGDIEKIKVLNKNDIYVLTQNDSNIGFFQVFNHGDTALVQNAYVDTPYRKRGIFTMFLLFLKRVMKFNKIQLGQVHSQDTIQSLKSIQKRFEKIYWKKGNKEIPYDPNTIDQFYGQLEPTGWNIILENYGKFDWPKYYDMFDLLSLYECYIDNN